MADTPDTQAPPSKGHPLLAWTKMVRWYWITRAVGVFMMLYGVLGDDTPERGTIILVGAGLAGFDKVKGAEPPKPPQP